MAVEAIRGYRPKEFIIESLDGSKRIDLTNSIMSIDYFEDILSPSVSMTVRVANAYSLINNLPIRGGEKVEIDIETASGDFTKNYGDECMYVYKVSSSDSTRTSEMFTLHLTTKEHFMNETGHVYRRYEGKISESVKKILSDVLKTTKNIDAEETANAYSFIGSSRKPFNVVTWLCPKSESPQASSSDKDPNGSRREKGTGTGGYFFFENYDGFNFKSIDSLTSKLQGGGSADNKKIWRYSYGGKVVKANDLRNNFEILNFISDQNIDVRKSLSMGMYNNQSYLYDPNTHDITSYTYDIKDELKDKKLGRDEGIPVPNDVSAVKSRTIVRTSDNGIMASGGGTDTSGRKPVDTAKSAARYNLLLTQSLNILVPCNIKLKVGDVVYCEFPEMSGGRSKEIDLQTSGNYLVRELRHHFSANQNTTSLRLMRDSYGVN